MECSIIIIHYFEVLVNELIFFPSFRYALRCLLGVDTASPAGNNTGVGGVCPVGSYCPEATITPLPCPPGQYR